MQTNSNCTGVAAKQSVLERGGRAKRRHRSWTFAAMLTLTLLTFAPPSRATSESVSAPITVRDLKLTGDLSHDHAAFTLTAIVKVDSAKGVSLELLSGAVALTDLGAHPRWRIRTSQDRY